jgi:hypothetical protein
MIWKYKLIYTCIKELGISANGSIVHSLMIRHGVKMFAVQINRNLTNDSGLQSDGRDTSCFPAFNRKKKTESTHKLSYADKNIWQRVS